MPIDSQTHDSNTNPHSIQSLSRPVQGPPEGFGPADVRPRFDDGGFYRWSQKLSSRLIDLRRDFGGDLDLFLLQLVFVQAEMSRGLSRRPGLSRGPGLNALSVADITAISRETTRRKLKLLAEAGFLQRGPDGLHYLSEHYGRDRFVADFSALYRSPQSGFA